MKWFFSTSRDGNHIPSVLNFVWHSGNLLNLVPLQQFCLIPFQLLRVQSRCQTLQRHMERLEAINHSRMEELEASVGSERDLRYEIRNLQRRIFELEAEVRKRMFIIFGNFVFHYSLVATV